MRVLRTAAVAAALCVLPGAAMAAPSVLGPSGFIFTPDGFTVPGGCIEVGYHHAEGEHLMIVRDGPAGPRTVDERPDVNAYKLNIGIGNRLEIGATGINTGEHGTALVHGKVEAVAGANALVNAKLSLLKPKSPFQLVGGVIDALDYVDRTPYLYGSLNVGPYLQRMPLLSLLPKRVQAGAGWATGMIDGMFVNAGIPVTPNVELMFEWLDNDLAGVYGFPRAEAGDSTFGGHGRQFNVGGRFRIHKVPGLAFDVATTDFEAPVFGISYAYCPMHHKKLGCEGGEGKGEGKGGQAMAPAGPGFASSGVFRTPR